MRRILHGNDIFALPAGVAQLGDRYRSVVHQPSAKLWIVPRPRNYASAIARANFILIVIDQRIKRLRIDITSFRQNALERANAKLSLRQLRMVAMIIVTRQDPSFIGCYAKAPGFRRVSPRQHRPASTEKFKRGASNSQSHT